MELVLLKERTSFLKPVFRRNCLITNKLKVAIYQAENCSSGCVIIHIYSFEVNIPFSLYLLGCSIVDSLREIKHFEDIIK